MSVTKQNGVLVWVLNGRVLSGADGSPVAVDDKENKPRFSKTAEGWIVTINGMQQNVADSVDANASMPQLTFSPSEDFLVCTFDDSTQIISPTYLLDSTLARVPNRGFYKDIFMDAGVYLTTRKTLPAATYLGYSLESVSCSSESDAVWQNTVIGGDKEDLNGHLLYPDGAPRYRILFVCGGKATKHSNSLGVECRERMKDFVAAGGSYVGTCAGAFFASSSNEYYLHLWPGVAKRTGISQSHMGLDINYDSPLLKYCSFGGDNYVANVRHNGGCYAEDWPVGTVLLAKYDYPQKPEINGKPAAWAYKQIPYSGRIVIVGSHPEEVASGERRDFTAAMLLYAADGVGLTHLKGILRNGKPRVMDKSSLDHEPQHTMIGDCQYHHYLVYIPKNARNILIKVSSQANCDIRLTISDATYAYSNDAVYTSSNRGSKQSLNFEKLTEGIWYVSVQQLTSVTATSTERGQEYSGRTDVLNGIPYQITVDWDIR